MLPVGLGEPTSYAAMFVLQRSSTRVVPGSHHFTRGLADIRKELSLDVAAMADEAAQANEAAAAAAVSAAGEGATEQQKAAAAEAASNARATASEKSELAAEVDRKAAAFCKLSVSSRGWA